MAKTSAHARVCILMGVYEGAAFLRAQLDSFMCQTEPNWALIVSDDSPQPDDGSGAILRAFQAQHTTHDITLKRGPQAGFAPNYLTLLRDVPPDMPYAALSDQDDVWLPGKLHRALTALEAIPDGVPALYCARTMVVAEDLSEIGPSPQFGRAPAFENALVQSIGGGNTMVLNRAALDLVAPLASDVLRGPGTVVAHDWWLYQVITGCGGQVLRDPEPALLYRQHGGNVIGANRSLRARLGRAGAVLGGRLRRWNRVNMAALASAAHHFTPQARAALKAYHLAQTGPFGHRLRALRASGVWRQGRMDNAALYLACLLRRL